MKKKFAFMYVLESVTIVLAFIFFILAVLEVRNIIIMETYFTPNTYSSFVEFQGKDKFPDDYGFLTVEVIENSFWEELTVKSNTIVSDEDMYISWVINSINNPSSVPCYPGDPYISFTITDIPINRINPERLICKLDRVIALSNYYHPELQVTMCPKILNAFEMQIDIDSTNVAFMNSPVTYVGQSAYIRPDSLYWEKSETFGAGKFGRIIPENPYIPDECIVQVTGVSYLDDNGNVISSSNKNEINIWSKRMIHVSVNGTDLGWVYPTDLKSIA